MTISELESRVNAEVGAGTIQRLSSKEKRVVDGLSSGSLLLNYALSGNPLVGYAWGRIVELYGPESAGKTTWTLHAMREAQKKGLHAGFIDAENALDPNYAEALGLDLEAISISQPDHGEHALQTAERMVLAGYRLVVVDSVAALVPQSELEGEIGDAHMGKQARMMGQGLRMLVPAVAKANALIIFTNQIRATMAQFGDPETTPGGRALKFFASYRVSVRAPRGGAKTAKISDVGKVETGIDCNVTVKKNKLAPPFRTAKVHINYGKGIDKKKDIADFLCEGQTAIEIEGTQYKRKALLSAMASSGKFRKQVMEYIQQEYAA